MKRMADLDKELKLRMALAEIGEKEAKVMKMQAEAQKVTVEAQLALKGGDGGEGDMAMQQNISRLNNQIASLQLQLQNKAAEINARLQEMKTKADTEMATTVFEGKVDLELAEINSHNEQQIKGITDQLADLRARVGEAKQTKPGGKYNG